jgi:hypothetical protein
MRCNRRVGARVVAIGAEAAFGDNCGAVEFFVAVEQSKLGEIACRPAREFLETIELTRVCSTPAGWIGGLGGCLQFDKCAWWRPCPLQRKCRAAQPLESEIQARRTAPERPAEAESTPQAIAEMPGRAPVQEHPRSPGEAL